MARTRRSRLAVALSVVAALVVVIVMIIVGAWLLAEETVEPDDPTAFYDPPERTEEAPGTVLRSETIAGAQPGATTTRVLYASTDPAGDPIAVSGVVITPDGAAPPGGRPVVAWAHGTSGVAPRCAPSLEQHGGVDRIPALDHFVDRGAIVVTTDYPGLGTPGPHPYLVGASEGRAVLDAARAAHAFAGDESGRTVVFGHSQGGHAVLFAAELAPTYAPELDLVGAAPMAPPTNLAELMRDDESEIAGVLLTALAVKSWSDYYPDTPAHEVVHEEFLPAIDDLGSKCIETNAQSLLELPDILDLKGRFLSSDPSRQPDWKPHFVANTPAAAPLAVPLFVVQGTVDDIVDPTVTAAYVSRECAAGSVVDYKTYPGAGHFEIRTVAARDVADWLLARTAGEPAASTCASD
jgi:acetyl esterase/lipase